MMLEKAKAIILKTTRYGEADLIVQCLTAQGAKLSLFARAALKSTKRFGGGVLEPTHYVQVVFKRGELSSLQEASLLQAFSGLRSAFDRLEVALYFLQVVSKLSQEGSEDPELFHLLGNALRAAEGSPRLDLLKTLFELKVLNHQGVLPNLALDETFSRIGILDHAQIEMTPGALKELQMQSRQLLQDYLG